MYGVTRPDEDYQTNFNVSLRLFFADWEEYTFLKEQDKAFIELLMFYIGVLIGTVLFFNVLIAVFGDVQESVKSREEEIE